MRIVEGHQKMGKETHEGQKAEGIGRLHQTSRRVADAPAAVHAAECTGRKGEAQREAGIEEMIHTSSPKKGGLQTAIYSNWLLRSIQMSRPTANPRMGRPPRIPKMLNIALPMLVPCIPPR
jgi:hypothetical protein